MRKKGIRRGSALVLTAILICSAFVMPKVKAAIGVDVDEKCDLQINCAAQYDVNGDEAVYTFSEVAAMPVTINLYKVADINVSGDYQAAEAFLALNTAIADLDDETTTAEWIDLAAEAKAIVEEAASEVTAVASQETEGGTTTFADLDTGLYLVDPQQLLSDFYQYDFTPYLISLPNNYYYKNSEAEDADKWVYDLTGDKAIGLKPAKSDRYGDLVIEKELDTYNASLGGATFVFQVEAAKTDIDNPEDVRVVYSDVVALKFDEPGKESITIQDIPAGAVVTVKEVYTGASYKVTSAQVQEIIILADPAEDTADDGVAEGDDASLQEGLVSLVFTNDYNGGLNGGTGLVNTFSYDSERQTWTHTATEESTPE